jgi:sugar (pentulose or hexulose) kinase
MLGRIGFEDEIVFAGGVAKNRCLANLLAKRIKKKILIPQEPQIVGALGAALIATYKNDKKYDQTKGLCPFESPNVGQGFSLAKRICNPEGLPYNPGR